MKTQCSQGFRDTLDACGLTYQDWRQIARRAHRHRTSRWMRQLTRKVQQVHTGQGVWILGRYVQR